MGLESSSLMDMLKEASRRVDGIIFDVLKISRVAEVLYKASRHLLEAGGKRLRPFFVIQSCRAVGGRDDGALYAAAAVELLHSFTLIHDDVMDEDDFRRNVPTVHRLWGVPIAIMAGDLLFAKAFEALIMAYDRAEVPVHRVLRCSRILAEASSTIAEGQAMDMDFESRLIVSENEYFEMISRKTASLYKASANIGALIGGGSDDEVKALSSYGFLLGLAFQIRDDILGLTADEKVLGKPVGSDVRGGKKTIITCHALSHANPEEREVMLKTLGNKSASINEVFKVVELMGKLGSIDYAEAKARELAMKAKKTLNPLKETDAKKTLLELADFIVARRY